MKEIMLGILIVMIIEAYCIAVVGQFFCSKRGYSHWSLDGGCYNQKIIDSFEGAKTK